MSNNMCFYNSFGKGARGTMGRPSLSHLQIGCFLALQGAEIVPAIFLRLFGG